MVQAFFLWNRIIFVNFALFPKFFVILKADKKIDTVELWGEKNDTGL